MSTTYEEYMKNLGIAAKERFFKDVTLDSFAFLYLDLYEMGNDVVNFLNSYLLKHPDEHISEEAAKCFQHFTVGDAIIISFGKEESTKIVDRDEKIMDEVHNYLLQLDEECRRFTCLRDVFNEIKKKYL